MPSPRWPIVRAASVLLLLAELLNADIAARAQEAAEALLQPEWLRDALDDYWADRFDAAGLDYVAPALVLYEQGIETACGDAVFDGDPFYCPADGTAYIDARRNEFVVRLEEVSGVIEDANVWGSAVVWQLGLDVGPRDEPAHGPEDHPFLSWCLAGAFVGHSVDEGLLRARAAEAEIVGGMEGVEAGAANAVATGYRKGWWAATSLSLRMATSTRTVVEGSTRVRTTATP